MVAVSMEYERLPRCSLDFFPTPFMLLPRRTERRGGPRIFMKREDQAGRVMNGLMDTIARGDLRR